MKIVSKQTYEVKRDDRVIGLFDSYDEADNFIFAVVDKEINAAIEERKDLYLYKISDTDEGLVKTDDASSANVICIKTEAARVAFNDYCDLNCLPHIQSLGWFVWDSFGDNDWIQWR